MSAPHIGVWLVALGFLTKRQLGMALEVANRLSMPFEQALVEHRMLTQEELDGARLLQEDMGRYATLAEVPLDPEVVELVPRAFAFREQLLPLRRIGQRLVVAYARRRERLDDVGRLLDKVAQTCELLVHGIAFNEADLIPALERGYQLVAAGALVTRAVKMAETTVRASQARQLVEVAAPIDGTEAPIIDLVNQILLQAIERGGSDLHLVPSEHTLDVQLRVDGVMQPLMTLPREVAPAVTGRLKIIAELDVSERRRPQDGRCTIRVSGRPVDLRAACIATHWGETLVMRILRPLEVPDGVGSLGLGAEGQVQWNRMIRSPNGLILVTGPTGSGKTSTLYATLGQIDRRERNVITVEDPVEYPLGGMRQIQVAPVAGITFASALRSILRLDPDVILIGEIRDEVTLEIALEAALTGHLVISTLHTNDAVSAVTRMIEMGAPRHQVAASLVGALAQRLVRRICRGCLRERPPTDDEAAFLGPEARTVAYGVGCDACAGVGFRGRLGVFEILESSAELSDAISGQASTHQLWRQARAEGLETLLEDGRRKVLQGQTTVAEVHRVIGARERHA